MPRNAAEFGRENWPKLPQKRRFQGFFRRFFNKKFRVFEGRRGMPRNAAEFSDRSLHFSRKSVILLDFALICANSPFHALPDSKIVKNTHFALIFHGRQ